MNLKQLVQRRTATAHQAILDLGKCYKLPLLNQHMEGLLQQDVMIQSHDK